MPTDYTTLDAAIMAAIAASKSPIGFAGIMGATAVYDEAKRLEAENGRKHAYRFVDSRLQAMRKAGRIRFSGAGWTATTTY